MKYTTKVGGIIILIMGIITFTGWMNNICRYMNKMGSNTSNEEVSNKNEEYYSKCYKDNTVFLNFWATGCSLCKMEMPYIEELYNEYVKNNGDIVILSGAQPNGNEIDIQGIKKLLKRK